MVYRLRMVTEHQSIINRAYCFHVGFQSRIKYEPVQLIPDLSAAKLLGTIKWKEAFYIINCKIHAKI
jgi:hypothetical protein